jgi:hypothetical protein
MAKTELTDEQVELEIKRLTNSEEVKLARAEQRAKYQRRQYMYQLRAMHKRGAYLMSQGIEEDNILTCLYGDDYEGC